MRKILRPVAPPTRLIGPGRPVFGTTRYAYAGHPYTVLGDATDEPGGACALFTRDMGVCGAFTTALPLEAGLEWANIAPLLLSFSFSDGLTVYASSDPRVRVALFVVSTDAQGAVTGFSARLDRFHSAAVPHGAGERLDQLYILDGLMAVGIHNAVCAMVGPGPDGAPDTCHSSAADTATSYGQAPLSGYPAPARAALAHRTLARPSWRSGRLLQ